MIYLQKIQSFIIKALKLFMTHDSFRDEYDKYNKIWSYRDEIFFKSMIVIVEIQGDPRPTNFLLFLPLPIASRS